MSELEASCMGASAFAFVNDAERLSKICLVQAAKQTLSELQQQLQSEVTKAKEQEVALSSLTQDLQASAQVCSTLWKMSTAVVTP